jgi:hypothetical protein
MIRAIHQPTPIIVVSGLPRSGTSLMMQMLRAGGVPIAADDVRAPDPHNPHGYFEFEAVKTIHEGRNLAWLEDVRGKAIKIVSYLLGWLPESTDYLLLFMRRDLAEVAASQAKMLTDAGLAEEGADVQRTIELYSRHLQEVAQLIAARSCFVSLDVDYGHILTDARREAARVAAFLGSKLDVDAMAAAVDRRLYRNRGDQSP